MKKNFLKNILLLMFIINIFSNGFPDAKSADLGHFLQPCIKLNGLKELPKLKIFARDSGEIATTFRPIQGKKSIWQVQDGDCISPSVSNGYAILDFYAIDINYYKTLNLPTYDPAEDSNAYRVVSPVNMDVLLYDWDLKIDYQQNNYLVAGVDNKKHQLVLVPEGYTTNQKNALINPLIPSDLSSVIGSEVKINTNVQVDLYNGPEKSDSKRW